MLKDTLLVLLHVLVYIDCEVATSGDQIPNYETPKNTFRLRGVTVHVHGSSAVIEHRKGEKLIHQETVDFVHHSKDINFSDCSTDAAICIEWNSGARLEVAPYIVDYCSNTSMSITGVEGTVSVCINMSLGHWYGGAELGYAQWPIETMSHSKEGYVPGYSGGGAVLERYWVSSTPVPILAYVQADIPLFVSQNTEEDPHQLCLEAAIQYPYKVRSPEWGNPVQLNYTMCHAADVKELHLWALENLLPRPSDIPDVRVLTYPIWSTWARYKTGISQELTLQFAQEIIAHNFDNSQIQIDDNWETCYGDLTFDTSSNKFPDPVRMVQNLHYNGFRVTLWVHPFINMECATFQTASDMGYLTKNDSGEPIIVSWWNGEQSGLIDFTNTEAVDWFNGRLNLLKTNAHIDSFKFDAGEATYLPEGYVLNSSLEFQPDIFTTNYVNNAATYGSIAEVRVANHNQEQVILMRMGDKASVWGADNGLKSLIPSLLNMNIIGYPYVLPDMIGGNGYSEGPPSRELFIRWLQVNVFMPTMQYSYVPWDFDDEVVEIARNMTKLHTKYSDLLVSLCAQAVREGTPVNRPLWWLDPKDSVALKIDSEFLLGDVVLSAPILDEGAVARDVYLPKGQWRQGEDGEQISGPVWLLNVPAPLNTLLYFVNLAKLDEM